MGKNKLLIDKYYNGPTNVYYIVDKEFLQGFNDNQAVLCCIHIIDFMKSIVNK